MAKIYKQVQYLSNLLFSRSVSQRKSMNQNKLLLATILCIKFAFHRITLFLIVLSTFYFTADLIYNLSSVEEWTSIFQNSILWLIMFNEFLFTPIVYTFVDYDIKKLNYYESYFREQIQQEKDKLK